MKRRRQPVQFVSRSPILGEQSLHLRRLAQNRRAFAAQIHGAKVARILRLLVLRFKLLAIALKRGEFVFRPLKRVVGGL
jgi:hypothetical protein